MTIAPLAVTRTATRAPRRIAPALAAVGPHWFSAVMGTGVVAVAAVGLPVRLPGAEALALAFWSLAAVLLVGVTAATAGQWRHHRAVARGHLDDPRLAHYYGAPAMAAMVVGAGAPLVGDRVVGDTAALALAWVLWVVGTALGLGAAVVVTLRTITTHDVAADAAFGGWLMPVVPPMVSAATGAALIGHLPAGQARQSMYLLCGAFFGLTLVASAVMTALVWHRLLRHGVEPGGEPTLWIVLGPLGQSITAAHHLGAAAPGVVSEPYAGAAGALAVVYGVPVWGFAMLWLAVVGSLTVRAVRAGLPFALSWWSFTFPVGTLVTGTSGLAATTGNVALTAIALLLFAALLLAWAVVAVRTLRSCPIPRCTWESGTPDMKQPG